MKKYLLIFTFFLNGLSAAKAQDDQPGDEALKLARIKALYIAYITDQLKITPDEAQKFWPIHSQFETELQSVKVNIPELEKQQLVLNIKKRYQENFTRILGPKRCERFIRMDGEFKHKLLERFRKQRQNQPTRPKIRRQ